MHLLRRGFLGTLLASFCFSFVACSSCEPLVDDDTDGGAPSLPLDEILSDGEVRCGRITTERELIGGDGAYGQVGDYRCMNRDVRFIVQGFENPVGFSAGGGTLIDIDLVRSDEDAPGEDTFRELIIAFGVNEVDVDSIEILDDGRQGGQAVLRVEGVPSPISVAPQASLLAQELIGRVRTDYILQADSPFIEVKTTFFNEGDDQIYGLLIADAVAFGAASPSFTPTSGFQYAPTFAEVPFIATGGNRSVSYAYVCNENDDVTLPFDAIGVKVSFCKDDLIVAREGTYSRFLIVGDGSIDAVATPAWEYRGVELVSIRGQVSSSDGSEATETSIVVLSNEDDERHAVSQTFADSDGRFELHVPPGDYEILAHQPRGARSPSEFISVLGDVDTGILVLSEVAHLIVETQFVSRAQQALAPLPAKLMLIPTTGSPLVDSALGEWQKEGSQVIEVSPDGNFDLDKVPTGAYELYVSRGFEFTRYQQSIVLSAGTATTVTANLAHVVDTDGLVATEFHQHSIGGLDSSVPMELRVLENAAEGIEFAAATEHDTVVDFRPYVEAWGIEDSLTFVAGSEVSYQGLGHFNVYPFDLSIQTPLESSGVDVWWQKTVPEVFADVREMAGDPIVQINHPRDGTTAFFTNMRLDPTTGARFDRGESTLSTLPADVYQRWPTDFDAIEVNGDLGQVEEFRPEFDADLQERAERSPGTIPTLHDYFALLGAGMRVTALANSDSHGFFAGVGYPRSFVASTPGAVLDEDEIKASIRSQQVMGGEGCLVELRIDGERVMGKANAISPEQLSRVSFRVQGPPHVVMERIEVYVNGRAQFLTAENGSAVINESGVLRLPLADFAETDVVQGSGALLGLPDDKDLVVVAIAHGDDGLRPTGGGNAYCFSAPLYVDNNEDGWEGWLSATQEVAPE